MAPPTVSQRSLRMSLPAPKCPGNWRSGIPDAPAQGRKPLRAEVRLPVHRAVHRAAPRLAPVLPRGLDHPL